MLLGSGGKMGASGGCFLGWDYLEESSRFIPGFAWFSTFPLLVGSNFTQARSAGSQDGIGPPLLGLSPASCSVRAWHGATGPELEGRKRVSPGGSQLSQLTQLDTLPPPPPGTQPPNFPFFKPVWWFSFLGDGGGDTPSYCLRAPGLQPGAASRGTRAPCPLARRALAQDNQKLGI